MWSTAPTSAPTLKLANRFYNDPKIKKLPGKGVFSAQHLSDNLLRRRRVSRLRTTASLNETANDTAL